MLVGLGGNTMAYSFPSAARALQNIPTQTLVFPPNCRLTVEPCGSGFLGR